MGISLLLFYQIEDRVFLGLISKAAWGLIALMIVAAVSILVAILDYQKSKKAKSNS